MTKQNLIRNLENLYKALLIILTKILSFKIVYSCKKRKQTENNSSLTCLNPPRNRSPQKTPEVGQSSKSVFHPEKFLLKLGKS